MNRILAIQGLVLLMMADTLIVLHHHFVPGPAPIYAFTLGVPNAFVGAAVLLVTLALSCVYVSLRHKILLSALLALLTVGALIGCGVFWLQTFSLRFFCPYAYGAAALSWAAFILGVLVWRKEKQVHLDARVGQ